MKTRPDTPATDIKDIQHGSLSGVRPVLLSGVYRSGTTFLTAAINNLPSFAAASSTVKYLRFCIPHHDNLEDAANLNNLLAEIAARILARWDLVLDTHGIEQSLQDQPKNHATVYNAVMQSLLVNEKATATRWAEKLAMQWRDIPLFLKMFPEGQVIHIFRDPRDVTSSYKKMTYEAWPTFMDASLNCKAAMIDVPKYAEQFGDNRVLMLKAEDMAADLHQQMEKICTFLGEDFSASCADLSQFSEIKGEDWRTNSSFDETDPNFSKATSRWQDTLSNEELFLVEMLCQPHMSALGYAGSQQITETLDPSALGQLLNDPWLAKRINSYLSTGTPEQGYRSDPYKTEMDIVFGSDER
ncbi:MAG: sulfotransferase family protein [Halocynthiibacter sp.]